MSGPAATVGNVERTLSLSQRTISLEASSFCDGTHSARFANGEISHRTENPCFTVGEILLLNGESYSGSLLGNVPEGSGKYAWSDGCKFEGEWRCGMRQGYGKLQWPSGAVYEGEFSGGYMHGTGTYTRHDKMIYKGRWRLNLKHGLGYQIYPNGDILEGSWIQGSPEGPGKYTWANGNVYLGNMKAGKMSGKGTLTWTNGDSYEGSWLNGMMHGFGIYTWNDGSCFIGTWTRGLKDGKGAFYPKGGKLPASQELYLSALRKRGLLPDFRKPNRVSHLHHASSIDMGDVKVGGSRGSHRHSSDKISKGNLLNLEQSQSANVSLERRWSLEVSVEKLMGHYFSSGLPDAVLDGGDPEDDIDPPILEREYMQGVLISELVLSDRFSSSSKRDRRLHKKLARVKRIGETIIKGHRSYDLMLSLQLGIRYHFY